MSIWNRHEKRDASTWDILTGLSFDKGGTAFNATTLGKALSTIPVYSATSLIADQFSTLPYSGYTTTNGSRQRLTPQPQICFSPHVNPVFTRVEWLHQYCTSFLLRANAYGVVTAIDGN